VGPHPKFWPLMMTTVALVQQPIKEGVATTWSANA
jgi:hypothetical protein